MEGKPGKYAAGLFFTIYFCECAHSFVRWVKLRMREGENAADWNLMIFERVSLTEK